MRSYDHILESITKLSYYVPLLISTGGNSGSQSSTLIIRGLAIGDIKLVDWWRILVRELSMGLVLGLGLGLVGFLRVLVFPDGDAHFAGVIGLTLVGIVTAGCTAGAMMPIALKRIGLDPATSSTPFIASLVDVLGIIIFASIARVVMIAALGATH